MQGAGGNGHGGLADVKGAPDGYLMLWTFVFLALLRSHQERTWKYQCKLRPKTVLPFLYPDASQQVS